MMKLVGAAILGLLGGYVVGIVLALVIGQITLVAVGTSPIYGGLRFVAWGCALAGAVITPVLVARLGRRQ